MFVVAKGSNCVVGEILYVAIVNFHHSLTSIYNYIFAAVRVGAFQWIEMESSRIPNEYDGLLQTYHSSDSYSYASYYSLSQAYHSLARKRSTLPPAQKIRPTVFVYWNHLKGGVDESSGQ